MKHFDILFLSFITIDWKILKQECAKWVGMQIHISQNRQWLPSFTSPPSFLPDCTLWLVNLDIVATLSFNMSAAVDWFVTRNDQFCWFIGYLNGGIPTPLKNISQLGWLFPICGKIKNIPNHQLALATITMQSKNSGMSFLSKNCSICQPRIK